MTGSGARQPQPWPEVSTMPKARLARGASLSEVPANAVSIPQLRHLEMGLPSSPAMVLRALHAHFGQIALMDFFPSNTSDWNLVKIVAYRSLATEG